MNEGIDPRAKERAAKVASQLADILPFLKASAQQRDRLSQPVTNFVMILQYLPERPRAILTRLSAELFQAAGDKKIYVLGTIFSEIHSDDCDALINFLSMKDNQAILNFYSKNIQDLIFLSEFFSGPLQELEQNRARELKRAREQEELKMPRIVSHRYVATDMIFSGEDDEIERPNAPEPLLFSKTTVDGAQEVTQSVFITERKGGMARTKSFDSFNLAALSEGLPVIAEENEQPESEEKLPDRKSVV